MLWKSWTPSTSSSLLVMPLTKLVVASSRRQLGIGDELRIRCIGRGGLCIRVPVCSRPSSKPGSCGFSLTTISLKSKSPGASIKTSWLAYRAEDRSEGKRLLQEVIDVLASGLPPGLIELKRLGRTLKRRATDVLAFFTRPGTSNGPTEAINGRLEHLRGSALGFRNLTHYIVRCLLESGGFRTVLHSYLR